MAEIGIHGIHKSFGPVAVLRDIELLDPQWRVPGAGGACRACGKSTLLRIVAGLETVGDGTIEDRPAATSPTCPRKSGTSPWWSRAMR